jgi:NAD(P)-dependent dehydrogenase (short-subunit alcohol dehydrogenase family)
MLLTGASSGIGKETAIALARSGAELTIVCRDAGKSEEAQREIARKSGSSSISTLSGDLVLLREVRRVAQEFASTHTKLEVLVNNAGRDYPDYAETEDGFERTMALNYFSPFLLTHLLLPLLEKGAPSRVVNVSSIAHFSGRLDLDNLNGKGDMGTGGLAAYGRSKLALVLFTYELARRTQGKGVSVNCLHPGAVRTGIWKHAGKFTPLTMFASLFMMGPKKGARTSIYLATSPEVEGVSGKYFERCREKASSERSRDPELARRLYELSRKRTGLA